MTVAEFLASCDGRWNRAAPSSISAIESLREQSGFSLSTDYLEFLRLCNGGDGFLDVQPCYLRIWQAEEVVRNNIDYQTPEFVPGFFAFGDSGGGEFFAFDTQATGRWPVVSIPFIPMDSTEARLVAKSFTSLLNHIVVPSDDIAK